jgi:hypothetical protein
MKQERLKRLPSTLLDQAPQIRLAVDHLHRPIHRTRQHLNPERLQPIRHDRRRIDPLAHRIRLAHHDHHRSSRQQPDARRVRRDPSELLHQN